MGQRVHLCSSTQRRHEKRLLLLRESDKNLLGKTCLFCPFRRRLHEMDSNLVNGFSGVLRSFRHFSFHDAEAHAVPESTCFWHARSWIDQDSSRTCFWRASFNDKAVTTQFPRNWLLQGPSTIWSTSRYHSTTGSLSRPIPPPG